MQAHLKKIIGEMEELNKANDKKMHDLYKALNS